MTDVLLVLTDPVMHDDLARCGAAAGYRLVRGRAEDCRREWLRARAVVADAGALAVLAEEAQQRPGVIAVGTGSGPDLSGLWRLGLTVGAQGGYLLPEQESGLVAALSRLRTPTRSPAGAVAVVGGHGGCGASTLAAAVALVAAASGARVMLADLDHSGGGLDLLLGAEDLTGLRWRDIAGDTGSIGGSALRAALPEAADGLCVVAPARDDPDPPGTRTVLAVVDAARTNGDFVVADVGRDWSPTTRAVLDSMDEVVVVTAATVAGVAASRRLVTRLSDCAEPGLVVRGPSPGGLTARQIAAAVGLPLLAGLRPQPLLARRVERGGLRVTARSPLGRVAGRIYATAARQPRDVA